MRASQAIKFYQAQSLIMLHEEFDKLQQGITIGSKDFINEMAKQSVKKAKEKVGVRTGKTKRSIEVKHYAKYTRADFGVDTWLIDWINNGGGRYNKTNGEIGREDGNSREYRQYFHTHTKTRHKKIKRTKMLKSHPAYYMLRPAKQLMGSVKSVKVYERNLKKQFDRINKEFINE